MKPKINDLSKRLTKRRLRYLTMIKAVPFFLLFIPGYSYSQLFSEVDTFDLSFKNYDYISTADMDNDGRLDIIMVDRSNIATPLYEDFVIYLNKDSGREKLELPLGLSFSDIDIADIDNDGDMDMLVVGTDNLDDYNFSRPVIIYENNNLDFEKKQVILNNAHSSFNKLFMEDIDNDNDLDIVLATSWETVYYQNDDAEFKIIEDHLYPNTDIDYGDIKFIDLNQDGINDVIKSYREEGTFNYFLEIFVYDKATGRYISNYRSETAYRGLSFDVSDLDNDGNWDIIASVRISVESPEGKFLFLEQSENGKYHISKEKQIPSAGGTIEILDMDLDGAKDIYLYGYVPEDTLGGGAEYLRTVFLNKDGDFILDREERTESFQISHWFDYDNDSDLDLLISGRFEDNPLGVNLFVNNAISDNLTYDTDLNDIKLDEPIISGNNVFLSWQKDSLPNVSYNLYVGTTNGSNIIISPISDVNTGYRLINRKGNVDSRSSIDVKGLQNGEYIWQLQKIFPNGLGSPFVEGTPFTVASPTAPDSLYLETLSSSSISIHWRDNSDNEEGFKIFRSKNDSEFELVVQTDPNVSSYLDIGLDPASYYSYYITAAGFPDSSPSNTETTNTGYFDTPQLLLQDYSLTYHISLDVDNDDDLDILFFGSNYQDDRRAVLFKNENGSLLEDISSDLGINPNFQVVDATIEDFNNDGLIDLFVLGYRPYSDNVKIDTLRELYINKGNARFEVNHKTNLPLISSFGTTSGDINGDGWADIFLTGNTPNGPMSKLFTNNKNGGFNPMNDTIFPQLKESFVEFIDTDNDGDLDIFLSGSDLNDLLSTHLFENQGNGNFKPVLSGIPQDQIGYFRWADHDKDNDLDLLMIGYRHDWRSPNITLYTNNGGNRFERTKSIFDEFDFNYVNYMAQTVVWKDINGDGYPDLTMSFRQDFLDNGAILSYLNNGEGDYEQVETTLDINREVYHDLIDINGDKVIDMLTSGDNGLEFYSNLTNIENNILTPPTELSVRVDGNRVSFTWDMDKDIPYYKIYLEKDGELYIDPLSNVSSGFNKVSSRSGSVKNSLTWVLPNGRYSWAVQKVDGNLFGSPFSPLEEFSVDVKLPIPPQDVSLRFSSAYGAVLTWEDNSMFEEYIVIERAIDNDTFIPLDSLGPNKEVFRDVSIEENRSYKYRLRAWNSTGYSGYTKVVEGISPRASFKKNPDILSGIRLSRAVMDWGDYNRDGFSDMMIMGTDTLGVPRMQLYKNENGTFTQVQVPGMIGIAYGDLKWVDVDNDNDLDIIATGKIDDATGFLGIYQNNGNDSFDLLFELSDIFPQIFFGRLILDDLNNDGKIDFLIIGRDFNDYFPRTGKSMYFENNSNDGKIDFEGKTFEEIGLENVYIGSALLADFNNDLKKEILLNGWRSINNQSNSSVINISSMTEIGRVRFEEANRFGKGLSFGDFYETFDIDKDMDTDYITNDSWFSTNLNINSSDQLSPLSFDQVDSIAGLVSGDVRYVAGDVNLDGYPDLVGTGSAYALWSTTNQKFILNNDRNSGFLPDKNVRFDEEITYDIDLVDYDNDGDLDLILTDGSRVENLENNTVKVYDNALFDTVEEVARPEVPTDLSLEIDDETNIATFSWNPPVSPKDVAGYTYNIFVKQDNSLILPPKADLNTGYRKVVEKGNTSQTTSWKINLLESGNITWGVQSIDLNGNGSEFAVYGDSLRVVDLFTRDSLALVDLYDSTNGPGWVNSWDLDTPVDNWYGVSFFINTLGVKRVIRLDLRNNGLDGQLPESFWSLTKINELRLWGNDLRGPLSGDIRRLSNLFTLDLGENSFSGEVPKEIAELKNLFWLGLSGNNFEGSFPVLDEGNRISGIDISRNDLEDIQGISKLNNLYRLNVMMNMLTFEDILPNIGQFNTYYYNPQDSIGNQKEVLIIEGNSYRIDLGIDANVENNIYTWYRNGNLIEVTNENFYQIDVFTRFIEGAYTCKITNPDLPDLELFSRPITLIASSEEDIRITLDNDKISENLPVGTLVGNLEVSNGSGQVYTFDLTTGEGSTNNTLFTIDGSQLFTNGIFDYETQSLLQIRISATMEDGASIESKFFITVEDATENLNNTAPTDIILSNNSLSENESIGFLIGSFSTIDEDIEDSHSYSLVEGIGSNDNTYFQIVSDSLLVNGLLDFEESPVYSVRVRTDDGKGGLFEKAFLITIQDIPDSYSLSGSVPNANSNFSIVLYKEEDGIFEPFIEKGFEDGNTFSFGTLPSDIYRIKVIPDKTTSPNLIPTFYTNFITLAEATDVGLFQDTENIEITLEQLSGTPLNGGGIINGRVVKDNDNAGGRVTQGLDQNADPIPGVNIYLLSSDSNEILAFAVSDGDGFFAFTNLPEGEYLLKVDHEGIPESPLNSTIKVNAQAVDNTLTVGIGNEIIWQVSSVTSLTDKSFETVIKLFPNPTSGSLDIEIIDQYIGEYQINIYSSSGMRIMNEKVHKREATLIKRLGLVDLPSGLYSIHITGKNESITRNFIKN